MFQFLAPPDVLVAPWLYLAGGSFAAFLIGLSKAGFGGGVGAIATPLILLLLPGPTALSLMLPVLIGCDIMTLREFHKEWDRPAFWGLAPWYFAGLFLGLALLVWFARMHGRGDLLIKLSVGLVVVGLTATSMLFRAPPATGSPRPGLVRKPVAVSVGITCGITTMVAHAAGVLLNLFLLTRRPTPASFVGTSTRMYLTFNLIKVPFYVAATALAGRSFLTAALFGYSLVLLPAGYLGVALGARLNQAIPRERYLRIVNALLLIAGAYLAASAGVGLWK